MGTGVEVAVGTGVGVGPGVLVGGGTGVTVGRAVGTTVGAVVAVEDVVVAVGRTSSSFTDDEQAPTTAIKNIAVIARAAGRIERFNYELSLI